MSSLSSHETLHRHTVVPLGMAFGLAFVSLSKFNLRPRLTFVIIAVLTSWAIVHSRNFPFSQYVNHEMPLTMIMFLTHQANLHCFIDQEVLEDERIGLTLKATNTTIKPETPVKSREITEARRGKRNWNFGYKMLFNSRMINTRWEAPRLDRVSQRSRTRWSFIWRRSASLLCRYILLCVYWEIIHLWMPYGTDWNREDFSNQNRFIITKVASLIRNPSRPTLDISRGIRLRLHVVLEYTTSVYLTFAAQHDGLAIIAVALHLDDPDEWPYLFGDVREAYSIRRYWGNFWHLVVYRSFNAIAVRVCEKGLKLDTRKPSTRYVINGVVFVVSALMHVIEAFVIRHGDSCVLHACWNQFGYWTSQVFGIFLEELIYETLMTGGKKLRTTDRRGAVAQVGVLKKLAGYIWVLCWLSFLVELFNFPSLRCDYSTVG